MPQHRPFVAVHKYLRWSTKSTRVSRVCSGSAWGTIESFQGFFTLIGEKLASQIEFACSDMWQPYLRVIREKCSQALHILDRFHIVAKMNEALDDVRAAESRKMAQEGNAALLKKSRWRVLKRKKKLTPQQKFRSANRSCLPAQRRLPAVLGIQFAHLEACSWLSGATKPALRIEPMKKITRMLRVHRELLLSRSFQKYASVFRTAYLIFAEGASSLASNWFKSCRLNFHSKGLAVDSQ